MGTKRKPRKDDNNFRKYVTITVTIIVVFGVGYLVGLGSMYLVSKKNVSEKYNKIENLEDSRVASLISNLIAGVDCWNIEEYANDHKVTVKDLSSERIFQVVQWGSFYDKKTSASLDEFNSEIQKYFSIGYSFDPEQIQYSGNCNPLHYNAERKEFYLSKLACMDACGPNSTQYKIVDVEDNGFDLKVTIRVLFGSQAESVHFYSDYARRHYITDDYEHLDSYFNQGDTYQFTFLRVDDNYLYVSSEKK